MAIDFAMLETKDSGWCNWFTRLSIKHMALPVWLRKERVVLQFNHLQDH